MERKDKIDIALKVIQTLFIVTAGIVALVKFSDYVDDQRVQRKKLVLDALMYYDEHTEVDSTLRSGITIIFINFEASNRSVTEKYVNAARGLAKTTDVAFNTYALRLETAIHMATLSGEQDTVNEYFCSDAHVFWVGVGPELLAHRTTFKDDTLFQRIEKQVVACNKFSQEEMQRYKEKVASLLEGVQ